MAYVHLVTWHSDATGILYIDLVPNYCWYLLSNCCSSSYMWVSTHSSVRRYQHLGVLSDLSFLNFINTDPSANHYCVDAPLSNLNQSVSHALLIRFFYVTYNSPMLRIQFSWTLRSPVWAWDNCWDADLYIQSINYIGTNQKKNFRGCFSCDSPYYKFISGKVFARL